MSSTNRGAVRQEFDYYVTPQDPIRRFLTEWDKDEPVMTPVTILDPCAGGNVLPVRWLYKTKPKEKWLDIPVTPMSYPTVLREFFPHATILTNDVRADSPADFHADFMTMEGAVSPDLIITNPPFSLAMPIICKALKKVRPGGHVVMLLRLNFFGSEERFPFFQNLPPYRAYIHHKRMSFTPDKGQDSIEYMHAIWKRPLTLDRPGGRTRQTITRVI